MRTPSSYLALTLLAILSGAAYGATVNKVLHGASPGNSTSPMKSISRPTERSLQSCSTGMYDNCQVIAPSQVYYVTFTGVCGLDFQINSDEGVVVFLQEKEDFDLLVANDFSAAYLYIVGSHCGDSQTDALRCSRSVTGLESGKTYVWVVLNRDSGSFFWSGDTATVQFDFDRKACFGGGSSSATTASFWFAIVLSIAITVLIN